MPLITVKQGGTDIEPGVYPVTLLGIEGPKTIIPKTGPNAGEETEIFAWSFAIDEGDLDGTEVDATTSTNAGPRSKAYAFLTALLGGKAPAAGQSFELADLAGRRALATITRSESGWPRIENLGAMPKTMAQARPQATATPLRAQVAAQPTADLPF